MKSSLGATLRDFEMDEKTFIQRIDEHNPINHLGGMAKAEVPIFIVHGDSDKVVPLREIQKWLGIGIKSLEARLMWKLLQVQVIK